MERLLQYTWKYKLFPLRRLVTTDGQAVEVVDPGELNRDAGPDFFNAKVKIGGTMWAGQVEIHERSTDWYRHGHQGDRAYDSVVLHVVGRADCVVKTTDGRVLPQLELQCPEGMAERYDELRRAEQHPPCYDVLERLPRFVLHSWLTALQVERCQRKADDISARLPHFDSRWDDVFFASLARNFGFNLNGDAFESWAGRVPFRAVDKHRDNLFQVEAIFFGQAGLLSDIDDESDDYSRALQAEHRYLSLKFTMPEPLKAERWRFARTRPDNFPSIRLAQLAYLYHSQPSLLSTVVEATEPDTLRRLLAAGTSDYWLTHYSFNHTSPRRPKRVGSRSADLLIINTIVPFLYAYGRYRANDALRERAARLLESLRPEDNYITRQWASAGIAPMHAADSQALIQLRKEYCDRRYCLRCRIGYEFLRGKRR